MDPLDAWLGQAKPKAPAAPTAPAPAVDLDSWLKSATPNVAGPTGPAPPSTAGYIARQGAEGLASNFGTPTGIMAFGPMPYAAKKFADAFLPEPIANVLAPMKPGEMTETLGGTAGEQAPNRFANYAGAAARAVGQNPLAVASSPVVSGVSSVSATAAREAGASDLVAEIVGIGTGLLGAGAAAGVKNWLYGRQLSKAVEETAAAAAKAKETLLTNQASAPMANQARRAAVQAVEDTQTALANQVQRDAAEAAAQEIARIEAAKKAAQGLVTQQFDDVATQVHPLPKGTAQTLETTGKALQESAREWVTKTLPSKISALWKPVDAALPGTTPVELGSFVNAVGQINEQAGALAPVAKLLKSRLPGQIGKVLDDILESPGMVKGKDAVQVPTGLLDDIGLPVMKVVEEAVPARPITVADAQRLRTAIGDALADPTVLRDVSSQNLNRLYAALTADMRAPHVANGSVALFDTANEQSSALFRLAEGPFSKIIAGPKATADDLNPGKVVSRLISDAALDGTDFAALRAELPKAADQLAALQLRGGHGAWSKLSPEAQAALLPDPAKRATIDAAVRNGQAAETAAETAIRAAKEARATATAAAKEARDAEIKLARRAAQVESAAAMTNRVALGQQSRAAAEAAANALAAKQAHPTNWKMLLGEGAAGGLIGHTLTDMMYPGLMAGISPAKAALLGGVAGLALPMAVQGVKTLARNPLSARVPLAAVNAASAGPDNALAPGR